MIQLFKPAFNDRAIGVELKKCYDKGWTGIGYKTEEFEEAWKKDQIFDHALFLNSATAGLHLALECVKAETWNPWDPPSSPDVVVTTPMTFVSTNHAIKYAGMVPWFCDIDSSLNMNPDNLEHYLQDDIYNRIAAVMFVCMGGSTLNLPEVADLCKKYKKKLIVDAAHAAGSHGVYGDYVVYSFQATKNLPTGDAGMLCCKEERDDRLARQLSWMGIDKHTHDREGWDYNVPYLGWKYNGNSIMAAVALGQLPRLDTWNKIRRSVAIMYDSGLCYRRVQHSKWSSRYLYQVLAPAHRRDAIIKYAKEHGVELGVHYRPSTHYPMYDGWVPMADMYFEELISLPIGIHLTTQDIWRVIDVMNEAI